MRSLLAAIAVAALSFPAFGQTPPKHSVVLFVADGLRPGMVNKDTAPAMAALLERGVRFSNSHALFPTFTTANASGLATGHLLGDTGDFSNTIFTGKPIAAVGGTMTPFLESDAVLGECDKDFGGDYLNEETILKAARDQGFSTASIGKVGPTLIFDHTERTGTKTIIVDDQTGLSIGIPLSDEVSKRLTAAKIPLRAARRGDNSRAGTATEPGTKIANVEQQAYYMDVIGKVVLPLFKERNKPFVLVYWSRDPDGTQHTQGDSLGRLVPGINGPTSLAAIKNADNNLAAIQAALKAEGMDATTDIVLTSDHGFSTISKESATSFAASQSYADTPASHLPYGFLAIDIAHGLGLELYDGNAKTPPPAPAGNSPSGSNTKPVQVTASTPPAAGSANPEAKPLLLTPGHHPSAGNGLIGSDPAHPQVVVASNGGSDLVYLPSGDRALAAKIVGILAEQDYVSGLFVDDSLGEIPGTLPLSAVGLKGSAVTPTPAIAVNFRSFSTGCEDHMTCGVEVADTGLQQGQGMHGNFSRADTMNIMGAAGPGFRKHFEDTAPASNADLNRTVAHILGLKIVDKGKLVGRVLTESLPNGGPTPFLQTIIVRSDPDTKGRMTVVVTQTAGDAAQSPSAVRYFDVAGYPGRTLGLPSHMAH